MDAAAPPPSGEPELTRARILEFFTSAARPDRASHLIGTELEKFGVVRTGGGDRWRPVSYEGEIAAILSALCEGYGWSPASDRGVSGEIIALERDGASITLEPGGQLELSGAPLRNVHETCAEFTQHYRELHAVSQPLGVAWLTAGFHPWARREDVNWMPKGRYHVMREYLPTQGTRGLDMMLRTCTVQANFDYADETNAGVRFHIALLLGPLITALFANSPLAEGRTGELRSQRAEVWTDVDPTRCGWPPLGRSPTDFSFERYADWALDAPMFFVKRDGRYHPHHPPFREFMAAGFTAPDGTRHRATYADWVLHASTVFPDVRLKPYIEVRTADAVGSTYLCALPALWKGLLYDETAGLEIAARVHQQYGHTPDGYADYGRIARTVGTADPQLREIGLAAIEAATRSLERMAVLDRKGRSEARFLAPLREATAAGRSPGSEALARMLALLPGRDVVEPGTDGDARDAAVAAFHFAGVGGADASDATGSDIAAAEPSGPPLVTSVSDRG
jgi:glutamate--cysteine ligase